MAPVWKDVCCVHLPTLYKASDCENQSYISSNNGNILYFCLSPGQRPFKCSYCPYSASQKGNLKTHVLCVHRMPFDNSQYPDRRFKRSRTESDVPDKNMDDIVGGITFNQPMAGADGNHGSNSSSSGSVPFAWEAAYCYHE